MDQEREDYADRDLPTTAKFGSCLVVAASSLLVFVLGITVTVLIERSIPPKVANPTEVYEGAGDYMAAIGRTVVGLFASIFAAVLTGVIGSMWFRCRRSRDRSDARTP